MWSRTNYLARVTWVGWGLGSFLLSEEAHGQSVPIATEVTMNNKVKIEVWSDFVCPFCYIGKRNLEAAAAQWGEGEVEWIYRSYQLQPDAAPAPGTDVYTYLAEAKGISEEESRAMHASVAQRARSVGLDFRFDDAVAANTARAHRWMAAARGTGRETALAEHILKAYFTEGRDIGDEAVLRALAEEVGFAGEALAALEAGAEGAGRAEAEQAVERDIQAAYAAGVRGVPHFRVVSTGRVISGAQPPSVFLSALQEAAAVAPR